MTPLLKKEKNEQIRLQEDMIFMGVVTNTQLNIIHNITKLTLITPMLSFSSKLSGHSMKNVNVDEDHKANLHDQLLSVSHIAATNRYREYG